MPTSSTSRRKASNNVASLNQPLSPHPARVQQIQAWHHAQADASSDPTVAALHVAITHMGQITTALLAMEPVHARIMLLELPTLRRRLRAHAKLVQ